MFGFGKKKDDTFEIETDFNGYEEENTEEENFMDLSEENKIQYSISFIENLANGINPLTGKTVSKTDCLNDISISRMLFYVLGILKEHDLYTKKKQKKSATYEF